jgi:hypothetical protein
VNIKTCIISSMFFVIMCNVFNNVYRMAPGVTTISRKTTVFREFEKCYENEDLWWGNTYCGDTFTNGPSLHECWNTPLLNAHCLSNTLELITFTIGSLSIIETYGTEFFKPRAILIRAAVSRLLLSKFTLQLLQPIFRTLSTNCPIKLSAEGKPCSLYLLSYCLAIIPVYY